MSVRTNTKVERGWVWCHSRVPDYFCPIISARRAFLRCDEVAYEHGYLPRGFRLDSFKQLVSPLPPCRICGLFSIPPRIRDVMALLILDSNVLESKCRHCYFPCSCLFLTLLGCEDYAYKQGHLPRGFDLSRSSSCRSSDEKTFDATKSEPHIACDRHHEKDTERFAFFIQLSIR